jgi:hypothetical protein
MAYQRAKVSAFKIVSTRTGHSSANEMGEFSTIQDLSVDGRTQNGIFTTSRPALPTMEMWTLRNDLYSRSSSQWINSIDEGERVFYTYLVAAIHLAYTLRSFSPSPLLNQCDILAETIDLFYFYLSLCPFFQFVFGYVILYPIVLEMIFFLFNSLLLLLYYVYIWLRNVYTRIDRRTI